MPIPPYTGPETRASLDILRQLLPDLPEPVVVLGGWGVRFLVNDRWRAETGQDYFGSRDIDLGFHTPPGATLERLKAGNLPATVRYLDSKGFTRQGMYSFVRYFNWDDDAPLTPEEAGRLPTHNCYIVTVDLIVSHERGDLREIVGFRPFSEPMLAHVFEDSTRRVNIEVGGKTVWVPAPHVILGMKLTSLPERTKDDKAMKDLCDIYALIAHSGVPLASLRSRASEIASDYRRLVLQARESESLGQAAEHLGITGDVLWNALNGLLPGRLPSRNR